MTDLEVNSSVVVRMQIRMPAGVVTSAVVGDLETLLTDRADVRMFSFKVNEDNMAFQKRGTKLIDIGFVCDLDKLGIAQINIEKWKNT